MRERRPGGRRSMCDGSRRASGSGANLVEAVGAIDRPVVAGQEGNQSLPAALGAYRRVHLPLSAIAAASPSTDAQSAVLLCNRSAALAALRLVHQPLAGIELLLAR